LAGVDMLHQVFKTYDVDKNGHLDRVELVAAMRGLGMSALLVLSFGKPPCLNKLVLRSIIRPEC